MTARDSFTEAAQIFLEAAEGWLTPEDEPAATSLLLTARALDKRMSGPLLAQFGLTHRHLMKRRDGQGDDVDPLERLLNGEQ